jgi:hypothetical protein
MHRDGLLAAQVLKDLHGLFGVAVLVFHEPARLVSADGQQRQVEAAASVSEPQIIALALAGLYLAGVAARRRRG